MEGGFLKGAQRAPENTEGGMGQGTRQAGGRGDTADLGVLCPLTSQGWPTCRSAPAPSPDASFSLKGMRPGTGGRVTGHLRDWPGWRAASREAAVSSGQDPPKACVSSCFFSSGSSPRVSQ